jgi:uncharacterized protein
MIRTSSTWREPMVWMLVGLPLASVVIGFGLLFAAVRPGPEDMETVGKTTHVGRMLVSAEPRGDAADVAAGSLVLRAKGDMFEALPVDGGFPRGGKLTLILSSPDQTDGTRIYQLSPSELGWRGVGSLDGNHEWLVQLAPDNAAWLLHGRWMPHASFIRLSP